MKKGESLEEETLKGGEKGDSKVEKRGTKVFSWGRFPRQNRKGKD